MSENLDIDAAFAAADEPDDEYDNDPAIQELNRLKALRQERKEAGLGKKVPERVVKEHVAPPSRHPEVRRIKARAMAELAKKHPRDFNKIVQRMIAEAKERGEL